MAVASIVTPPGTSDGAAAARTGPARQPHPWIPSQNAKGMVWGARTWSSPLGSGGLDADRWKVDQVIDQFGDVAADPAVEKPLPAGVGEFLGVLLRPAVLVGSQDVWVVLRQQR